jgi:hypothetical protein
MARVFFPTASLNRFGVRDTDQRATLGAIVQRFPAEPTPRAAMTATPPILGMIAVSEMIRAPYDGGITRWAPIYYPQRTPMAPTPTSPPVSSSGGGGSTPTPPAPISATPPPVSAQVLPTPTVTVPPPAPTGAILISSGGGTQTPATAPIVSPIISYTTDASGNIINSQTGALVLTAAQASSMGTTAASLNAGATPAAGSASVTDQVTAWLGGSTALLGYNVPNAVLAGVVVLGFAFLSSSGKKR